MAKMPQDFPSWYATVEAGQKGDASARWAGVAKALERPQVEDVEALIRIAFKSRQGPDEGVVSRITENIRTGDPTFGSDAAGRELQVLAASALAARLVPSGIAALALTTAGLDGARKPNLPMDLALMAENAVRSSAKTSRARVDVKPLVAAEVDWSLTEEEEANTTPFAQLDALHAAANEAIKQSIENASDIIAQLGRRQELVDEELQMLWWLTASETSAGVPLSDLKQDQRSLVVGDELARRTVRRPGPMSLPALLSRSGLSRKTKVKLVDAVNAMADEWCKSIVSGQAISPVTHPIHEAIRRRVETGQGPDWIKNWSAVCEVDETLAISTLRLAELFYRERLLLTVPA